MSWQKMFAPWILNRGRNYWDDGCVERLCQDGGTVTAVVSGTEDYDVEIEMGRGGSIEYMSCTCPYAEEGNNCKHMSRHTLALSFQSTLPVRGATSFYFGTQHERKISIHAPRAGSDKMSTHTLNKNNISIHAPRAGSDGEQIVGFDVPGYFNPRSPCGERPGYILNYIPILSISIHAPRAGSDDSHTAIYRKLVISIHAPRAGSDRCVQ